MQGVSRTAQGFQISMPARTLAPIRNERVVSLLGQINATLELVCKYGEANGGRLGLLRIKKLQRGSPLTICNFQELAVEVASIGFKLKTEYNDPSKLVQALETVNNNFAFARLFLAKWDEKNIQFRRN